MFGNEGNWGFGGGGGTCCHGLWGCCGGIGSGPGRGLFHGGFTGGLNYNLF